MEEFQRQYIRKNLPKLTADTRNLSALALLLIAREFLSNTRWQNTKRNNHSDSERAFEIYTACMKTAKYNELIQILDDTGNEVVANILRNISE